MSRVLIAGAGLGGLVAAIAMVQRGFAVSVFEAAPVLGEVGAGLTVSRSAQSVFAAIGILDRVHAIASLTSRMAFLHYRSGRLLTGECDRSDGRWHADRPQGGIHIHRADLHALLVDRFAELAPGRLHLGKRAVDVDQDGEGVEIAFADGDRVRGDVLIGADGIRSCVRARLWGDDAPRFTGQVAYRFLMPRDVAAPFLGQGGRAAVYLGPGRVFNRYTLRGGDIVNCVAITQSDAWRQEGWSTPADVAELLALYAGWHDDVTGLIAAASPDTLIKWGLFDRPALPRWGSGRATLLGDAAHPMLPFLGLGAAMAIEDAMVLARALAVQPGAAGLTLYEALRQPRANRIADLSRQQGEVSQARDPDRYDPGAAPAHDPSIQDYDPVTVPLEAAGITLQPSDQP